MCQASSRGPLRFVLLEHDTRANAASPPDPASVHWDLMIELAPGAALATWRLSRDPSLSDELIPAERIADHRRDYLEYQGPISGGRGRVRRIDEGHVEFAYLNPHDSAPSAPQSCPGGVMEFAFHGSRIVGPRTLLLQ
ncbi:MAG: hypothetical protein U1D55_07895 [Phycisphaerae bacterium]